MPRAEIPQRRHAASHMSDLPATIGGVRWGPTGGHESCTAGCNSLGPATAPNDAGRCRRTRLPAPSPVSPAGDTAAGLPEHRHLDISDALDGAAVAIEVVTLNPALNQRDPPRIGPGGLVRRGAALPNPPRLGVKPKEVGRGSTGASAKPPAQVAIHPGQTTRAHTHTQKQMKRSSAPSWMLSHTPLARRIPPCNWPQLCPLRGRRGDMLARAGAINSGDGHRCGHASCLSRGCQKWQKAST